MGDIEEQDDVAPAKCATPNELSQQPPAGPMLSNAPRGEGCGECAEEHANPEQSPGQIRTLLEAQTERVQIAHVQDEQQRNQTDHRTDEGECSFHRCVVV